MYKIKDHLIFFYLRWIKRLSLPKDLIRYAVKRHAGRIAIVDGKRQITYSQLYERAKSLANAFLGLGLDKGDRVGILIYNCQEYFEIRIATYLRGIVLVPLIWDLELENIISILNDCQVKAFIYHPEILKENIKIVRQDSCVRDFIPISGSLDTSSYENLIQQKGPSEPKVEIKDDDLASINSSSGTTGKPKGIMLTQKNWVSSFYNYLLNSNVSLAKGLIVLHTIPFATAGSTAILPCIATGAKSIVMSRFEVERAVFLINKHKVNRVFLTPSWFICLLEFCKSKGIRLSSLQAMIIGTDPIPQEKLKEGIDFFGPIIEVGYGMAEVLPPLSLLCPRDYIVDNKLNEKRLLSVGRVLKGIKIKIIDKKGKELPSGKTGRIMIKSTTISKGYYVHPELTGKKYRNDWFYSDDFGYVDKDGYLYICGRGEDILKEDKEKMIFSRQIAEVLHRHPKVLEACVVFSETNIRAFVSLRKGVGEVSSEELREFCRGKLEEGIILSSITILSEIPKSASGKINRKLLRQGIR